jgi:hypothetical protein
MLAAISHLSDWLLGAGVIAHRGALQFLPP